MLFYSLRGVGGSTQRFCAMSLGPLPLGKVGSIMTDSYDNRIPPHNCKWGHLIQLTYSRLSAMLHRFLFGCSYSLYGAFGVLGVYRLVKG